ncbi:PREDICTED: uncharacterized protein LOC109487824 [Branchiostoma belcheri]|uniref:Uncharacterized protein LOC109487824 n=1 Tax=Branchiostoma belcheri TaxID=7741 RepID=A0A6P5ACP6_BRABE|nr:PREDICTED: uncharacterized protein LOC109487824 [Branchiostoma belcheri]
MFHLDEAYYYKHYKEERAGQFLVLGKALKRTDLDEFFKKKETAASKSTRSKTRLPSIRSSQQEETAEEDEDVIEDLLTGSWKKESLTKRFRRRRAVQRKSRGVESLNQMFVTHTGLLIRPYEKFKRIAQAVRIITKTCISLKSYISGGETKEWSLVEMQLNLQKDFNQSLYFNRDMFSKLRVLLALLRHHKSFQDYPTHTQILLSQIMIYQNYEARRIVLKQGHRPFCFYIILSGTVLINVKEKDERTGKTFVRTVRELSGGDVFGETAMMSDGVRGTTVVCKDEVELLVIEKEDFNTIIREPLEKQREEHVQYVRDLPLFEDWPVELLRTVNHQFMYQYYKKGNVVVKNWKENNYLVIVKSVYREDKSVSPDIFTQYEEQKRRRKMSNPLEAMERANKDISPHWVRGKSRGHPDGQKPKSSRSQDGKGTTVQLNVSDGTARVWRRISFGAKTSEDRARREAIAEAQRQWRYRYAEVATLGEGSVFGLETLMQKPKVKLSLISDDAECILLSKQLFLKEATPKCLRCVNDMLTQYPSLEFVRQQLQQQKDWVAYKSSITQDIINRKWPGASPR